VVELFLVLLGTCFQHYLFDYGPLIRPALLTSMLGGPENLVFTALLALDHDALRTPPVNLAHRYVLNLIVRVEALDNFRDHRYLPLSLFPFVGGHQALFVALASSSFREDLF
jgi:hypothetical protein